jgi:MFS superfamily sulfate permease-like transporter
MTILKNIFAGFSGVALLLVLMIGVSISSGAPAYVALLPLIAVNLLNVILNRKSMVVCAPSASLIATIATIYMLYGSGVNPIITFIIPSVFFILLSFIKNIDKLLAKIPVSGIAGIALGLGIILILKQVLRLFDIHGFKIPENFAVTSLYFPGIAIGIFIPVATLLLNKKWQKIPWLFIVSIFAYLISLVLPADPTPEDFPGLGFRLSLYSHWVFDSTVIFRSIRLGGIITFIMLLDFVYSFRLIQLFNYGTKINAKKLLLGIGIGNLLGTFLGGIPVNISTTNTINLGENKATNGVSVVVMLTVIAVIAFLHPASLGVQLYVIMGTFIYIGIRLIINCFRVLKGTNKAVYIIALLTALVFLLFNIQFAVIFGLLSSIMYELIRLKKEKDVKNV